ncbi:hypothetical protein CkaCkLH20_12195 [Colletotrichum karsti]|uniref:Uncharacterized protein n=1 Tax=Colletotrichum karsti TaxID=1095194 RepID=A0A9P6HTJ4_9PEZI|nr:uncharacterized protein CkaCkLH20_12195 [Colletotrichum karsti]KAF9870348.1 hypothetical protein CkaCkLH20_12195 [Colletotrichum karsti]
MKFLNRHSHIKKLCLDRGTDTFIDDHLLPCLSNGNWANLNSLSLTWEGPGMEKSTRPHIARVSESALAAIGSLDSLEQLSLTAGVTCGWRRQWLIDHDAVRESLKGLTRLKRLAISRDTYPVPFDLEEPEYYYAFKAADPEDRKLAKKRNWINELEPIGDSGGETVHEADKIWEYAHRYRMFKQAEKYAEMIPTLEWVYCGEWPMNRAGRIYVARLAWAMKKIECAHTLVEMADNAYICSLKADHVDETQGQGLLPQGHSILDQCLDFAIELSKGRFFQLSSQFPSNEFSLNTTAFADLTHLLRDDPRVSIDEIRLEYDPSSACARFKMPASRIHNYIANQLCQVVVTASASVLPNLQWAREENLVMDDDQRAVIVDAAYQAAIEDRCTECLQRTNGFIRAAIAIKIPYESSYATDASPLRDRLHECLVSLWVWREGQVQCDIHWKSINTRRAYLTLKKSYFTDDVPAPPFPTQHSTRNRNRLSTPSEPTEPAEPAVCIPFTRLKEIIEQAIEYQISVQ